MPTTRHSEAPAAIRKLRKKGVGINKIARTLGIGVRVVQRIVSAN
jgi:hypothetical protein